MKIVCRSSKENGDVFESVIVENIENGYENFLLQPLIKSNKNKNIEYLLRDNDYIPYCYVSDIG